MRKEAEALQLQLSKERADQERQRQDLIRTSREQAEADRKRILGETEAAVQRRQEEMRQALAHERADALKNVRDEVVQQAIAVAGRLLREAADTNLHRQLVARLVEDLHQRAQADPDQVRAEWTVTDGVLLETAAALDEDSLDEVRDAVRTLLGQPVDVAVQPRPELLGGVRLRIGGRVWDASLAGQLEPGKPSLAEAVSHG